MKRIFAALVIVLLSAAVYAPAVRDGFVWDDTALVLRDPLIRSWRLVPESFNHFLFIDATPSEFYRPLQRLTYTLDYAAVAFQPALFHVSSILWHALAALALFFLAEELMISFGVESDRARWVSFAAAILWAIHPINSAAVIYVSGRADPLAAALGFAGLYLVLCSLRASGRRGLLLLVAAAGLFLLSALSKESGLIFPVLAIALFALLKQWRQTWKIALILAFVCASYFSLRLGAEHYPPPVLSAPAPSLVRPIVVSRAIAEYAGLILFPLNLHMDRDVESHPSGLNERSITGSAWRELQTLLGIVLAGALVYWMIRARSRNFPVFACLILFVMSYLPISGLVTLNSTVAEHWLYVPGAFFFLAAILQAAALLPARETRTTMKLAVTGLFALWLIFLGARSFVRTFDWKDERTFFERTIAQGGDSARMLINLGALEMNAGKLEDAALRFHGALEKKPDQPFALINLAAIALKQNDLKLARQLLERAVKMEAVEAQANEMLTVLEHKESGKANVLRMRLASRTGMPSWSIEKRYIQLLDQTGALTPAIKELQLCLTKQWYRAESWQLLEELLNKANLRDLAALASIRARQYDVHLESHNAAPPAPAAALPSS